MLKAAAIEDDLFRHVRLREQYIGAQSTLRSLIRRGWIHAGDGTLSTGKRYCYIEVEPGS
jgi:hypothetical protein